MISYLSENIDKLLLFIVKGDNHANEATSEVTSFHRVKNIRQKNSCLLLYPNL